MNKGDRVGEREREKKGGGSCRTVSAHRGNEAERKREKGQKEGEGRTQGEKKKRGKKRKRATKKKCIPVGGGRAGKREKDRQRQTLWSSE